jgi:hypothetical protein
MENELTGAGHDEAEWWNGTKARVFISCGQRGEEEKRLAREIRGQIRRQGFVPYMAFEVHSSKALTEGIYAHLRSTDYFLFVDFRRERLGNSDECRGSLFSNQELAIASFLEVNSLYFLERGIKQRDGILGAIQGNPIEFSHRDQLISQVEHEIRAANWNTSDRREMRIERTQGECQAAVVPAEDPGKEARARVRVRYYHMTLRNLSTRITATDCKVQVLGIRQIDRVGVRVPDVIEMKWKHITWPTVSIPPETSREFDGMLIPEDIPHKAILGILNTPYVDSGRIVDQCSIFGPGNFEVDIVAYSREFAPAKATLVIHLGDKIEDADLSLKNVAMPESK